MLTIISSKRGKILTNRNLFLNVYRMIILGLIRNKLPQTRDQLCTKRMIYPSFSLLKIIRNQ